MKISRQSRLNKKLAVGLLVALLVLAGASVYVYAFNGDILGWNVREDKPPSKSNPATDEQKKAGDEIKKDSIEKSKSNTEDDPQPSSQTNENGKKTVSVTITAAAQNGSTFQIRADIGTVTDTGTCTLTLSKGGAIVTKTATLQAMANSSTCRGFDVPVSELSPGDWRADLSFDNVQSTGSASVTKEIK